MEKLLDEKQNCEGRKREKHRHTETKRQTEMRNTEINGLVWNPASNHAGSQHHSLWLLIMWANKSFSLTSLSWVFITCNPKNFITWELLALSKLSPGYFWESQEGPSVSLELVWAVPLGCHCWQWLRGSSAARHMSWAHNLQSGVPLTGWESCWLLWVAECEERKGWHLYFHLEVSKQSSLSPKVWLNRV